MLKISFLSLFIILFHVSYAIIAANQQDSTRIMASLPIETAPLIEKVYLHFDRTCFVSGEKIWYKAYLANASDNQLSDNSNCLYVELISPASKIFQRNMIRMENGTGFGDFALKDTLPSGKYLVRAYTNWMRNFNNHCMFTKEIEIVNLRTPKSINKDNGIVASKRAIDIQFFPEGGSLVEEVPSRVGFKAINASGKGCKVTGKLMSLKGGICATFESSQLGMGSFTFIPAKGETYRVEIANRDTLISGNNFPLVQSIGYVMKVSWVNDSILIGVLTNKSSLNKFTNEELTLKGEMRGIEFVATSVNMNSSCCNIIIPKKDIPEGIARFTITDRQNRPWCERLLYIDQKKNIFISIKPDKESYSPHEKVTLFISAKDSIGAPAMANISLSATDGYILKNAKGSGSDINTYFMLESEILGTIEQPSVYFDALNPNRSNDLDLLLLTQGWRDFVWKQVADSIFPFRYPKENGINISGKLYTKLTHKPKMNTKIALSLFNDSIKYFSSCITDSIGGYYFKNLDLTGPGTAIVSAFNDEHQSAGEITIDSLAIDPAKVNYVPLFSGRLADKSVYFNDEIINNQIFTDGNGFPTISIEEVTVTGKRELENNIVIPYFDNADWSGRVAEKDYSYPDVFSFLKGKVAGLYIIKSGFSYQIVMRGTGKGDFGTGFSILLLLDGREVNQKEIMSTSMMNIDRIEVQKLGAGIKAVDGVISVVTKKGINSIQSKKNVSSINKTINGFYQARVFYSPKYDIPDSEKKSRDLRTTIYWQPNIITDKDGNATVIYYNDDKHTSVNINAEGIADGNSPVVGKATYLVK